MNQTKQTHPTKKRGTNSPLPNYIYYILKSFIFDIAITLKGLRPFNMSAHLTYQVGISNLEVSIANESTASKMT